jgi:hypothetical protein
VEEIQFFSRWDAQEAVRLRNAARDLGEELRARDADGDRDADALANLSSQPQGDLARRAREPSHPSDIEECLVDGKALDEWSRVLEHAVERLARVRIGGHARRDRDCIGAKAAGPRPTHRGADAERLGLVARGQHDAAADDHGAATKTRIVPLLDRSEKRIGVCVQDRRLAQHEHMFAYREVGIAPLGGGTEGSGGLP